MQRQVPTWRGSSINQRQLRVSVVVLGVMVVLTSLVFVVWPQTRPSGGVRCTLEPTDLELQSHVSPTSKEFLASHPAWDLRPWRELEESVFEINRLPACQSSGLPTLASHGIRKFRPRLAIVVGVDSKFLARYSLALSARNCYAATWGYASFVDTYVLQRDRNVHFNKLRVILKYLPLFEYVLWLDADVAFASRDRSLDFMLRGAASVSLQVRNITSWYTGLDAGGVLFRNDAFAFDFLRRWMAYTDNPADNSAWRNSDNGVLHLAVLASSPDYRGECDHLFRLNSSEGEGGGDTRCFFGVHSRLSFPRGHIRLFSDVSGARMVAIDIKSDTSDVLVHTKDSLRFVSARDVYCI